MLREAGYAARRDAGLISWDEDGWGAPASPTDSGEGAKEE
jgi:hypothetical protein